MPTKLLAPALRAARPLLALAAVLALALLLTDAAAAATRNSNEMQSLADNWAHNCLIVGGTPDVFYTFDENFEILDVSVNCKNVPKGLGGDWACYADRYYPELCTGGFSPELPDPIVAPIDGEYKDDTPYVDPDRDVTTDDQPGRYDETIQVDPDRGVTIDDQTGLYVEATQP